MDINTNYTRDDYYDGFNKSKINDKRRQKYKENYQTYKDDRNKKRKENYQVSKDDRNEKRKENYKVNKNM